MISLDHQAHEDRDLVLLNGRLVASVSAGIADELIVIYDNGCGVLHLDLSAVSYIDSSGLSALVSVMKSVQKQEGAFALVNISDEVLTLLELTRLHEVFTIFNTEQGGQRAA